VSKKTAFFISRRGSDSQWAEWIAWTLEDAGHTTFLQDWDFAAGMNIPERMQAAAISTERTIVVLSPDYFDSRYTKAEWLQRFFEDPDGTHRAVIPIRVKPCELQGMLATIIYIDLVGKDEEAAKRELTRHIASLVTGRLRPTSKPMFPGTAAAKPKFPGGEASVHPYTGPPKLAPFTQGVRSGRARLVEGQGQQITVRFWFSDPGNATKAFAEVSEVLTAAGVVIAHWELREDGQCTLSANLPRCYELGTLFGLLESIPAVTSIGTE
jgi:hypothetical protein